MTTSPPVHVGLCAKYTQTIPTPINNEKQHTPFPCTRIDYGTKKQYATQQSTAPLLDKNDKTIINNNCVEIYSLLDGLLIQLYCVQSVLSHCNLPLQPRI